MSTPLSKTDFSQVIRSVFHDDVVPDNRCLRVCVINSVSEPVPVVIVDASAATKFVYTDDVDFLAAGLSTSVYTEIFSYTATQDFTIKDLKVKADTFGIFSLKINGTIIDYFQTSEFNRNAKFNYDVTVDVSNTDIVSIEFRPDRIRIANYNFFLRIEGHDT